VTLMKADDVLFRARTYLRLADVLLSQQRRALMHAVWEMSSILAERYEKAQAWDAPPEMAKSLSGISPIMFETVRLGDLDTCAEHVILWSEERLVQKLVSLMEEDCIYSTLTRTSTITLTTTEIDGAVRIFVGDALDEWGVKL